MPCPKTAPYIHLKFNRRTRHAVSLHLYEMTTKLPQRKSPRAKWLDYNEGEYFVTICTHNWIHYFGEIADGEIHLSQIGLFFDRMLREYKNTPTPHQHFAVCGNAKPFSRNYRYWKNGHGMPCPYVWRTSCKRNTELQTAITLNIHCFFKVSRNKICPHNRQQIHMAKTISRPCHSWYRRPQQHITIHRKQYHKLGQRLF